MSERVVIAVDKFKGSLTSPEVASRVTSGLRRGGFTGASESVAIADGGEGTVAAALAAGFQFIEVEAHGALGGKVTAGYALRDEVAVIEAAQVCGLTLVPTSSLAPLAATSRGVGELILSACEAGARRVVLGVGGVASTDGGAGLLQALGARLLDSSGRELPFGGGQLGQLETMDATGLADLSRVQFLLASDVDNPLIGPNGAAAVYGPQKGATKTDVQTLESGLRRWADVAQAALGSRDSRSLEHAPGAGAAGGIGFAALLFLGAQMRPGIELVLELAEFDSKVDRARLIVTGEGSIDAQTLRGKAAAGVARSAGLHRPAVPVVAVAGQCTLSYDELTQAGISRVYCLTDLEPNVSRCIAEAGPLLEQLSSRIASDWLL